MYRQQALRHVSVPIEVRQLLADLRTHLREKIEPPVYVSDRRLVKAVGLMQVTALLQACPNHGEQCVGQLRTHVLLNVVAKGATMHT